MWVARSYESLNVHKFDNAICSVALWDALFLVEIFKDWNIL